MSHTENWNKNINAGDRVSYHDVNLWFQRGTLVRFAKGRNGGDCFVKWDHVTGECEALASTLVAWRASS